MECGRQHLSSTGQRTNSNCNNPPKQMLCPFFVLLPPPFVPLSKSVSHEGTKARSSIGIEAEKRIDSTTASLNCQIDQSSFVSSCLCESIWRSRLNRLELAAGPQRDTGFVRAVRAHPLGWKASGLAMDCGRRHLLSTGQRTNSNCNYPPKQMLCPLLSPPRTNAVTLGGILVF
jgi:hypothetical protein